MSRLAASLNPGGWLSRGLPWLFAAFVACLMLSAAAAQGLAITLLFLGLMALFAHPPELDRLDWRLLLILGLLPAAYLLNMFVGGWNLRFFDRPAHLLAALPIYLLVRRTGLSPMPMLVGLGLAGLGTAGYGLHDLLVRGLERPQGPFSSAGPYGNVSAVLSMLGLAGWIMAPRLAGLRTALLRTLAALALFGGLAGALMSETRSAWLAIPVLAGLAVASPGTGRRRRHWPLLLAVMLIAGAGLLLSDMVRERLVLGLTEVEHYIANPADEAVRHTSLGLRLLSWKWGLEQFLAHPVFGLGLAGFRPAVAAAVAAGTLPPELATFNGLHNLLVDHLAMTGLVGTGAMVLFWIALFRHWATLRRATSGEGSVFVAWGLVLVAGELIFACFGSMFASALGTLGFVVLLAAFAAAAHPSTPRGRPEIRIPADGGD